jgi:hypothetical protein
MEAKTKGRRTIEVRNEMKHLLSWFTCFGRGLCFGRCWEGW